jgi:biotin synthase
MNDPVLTALARLRAGQSVGRDALALLLATRDAAHGEAIRQAAETVLLQQCGQAVRLRGLIEFSNRCVCDCLYCGIRRGNRSLQRFTLAQDEIVACARWCAERGYASVVLQSGERRDAPFIRRLTGTVRAIKAATRSARLPEGLGITLCVGEQSRAVYQQLFDAGAHRYLLRMETSDPALFARLHPAGQRYETRRECLTTLSDIGYQLGTGVMIGLPGQSVEQLADDLLFFRELDVDMLGMGPYIPHRDAAMARRPVADAAERMRLGLRMIALARLLLVDVNIAATTALQTLDPAGRERGLRHGANVLMPQVTPLRFRRLYTLYEGKPCMDDDAEQCAGCLEGRVHSVGRYVAHDEWGDSAHYHRRRNLPVPGTRRVIPVVAVQTPRREREGRCE